MGAILTFVSVFAAGAFVVRVAVSVSLSAVKSSYSGYSYSDWQPTCLQSKPSGSNSGSRP